MKIKPFEWVKNILGKVFDWIKPKANDAIAIVNFVKSIVESDVTGSIVYFTKTKADDIALAFLRANISNLLEKMELVHILQSSNDVDQLISKFVDYLKSKSKYHRGVDYREFAALIIESLADDGKISHNEAIAIISAWYAKQKEVQ